MSRISRRYFLIGSTLASVAACTLAMKTHRHTAALNASDVMPFSPNFRVLITDEVRPIGTALQLMHPDHAAPAIYIAGITITAEEMQGSAHIPSGDVLYDPASRMLQRLHEDRCSDVRGTSPSSTTAHRPVYGLRAQPRPARGGHC